MGFPFQSHRKSSILGINYSWNGYRFNYYFIETYQAAQWIMVSYILLSFHLKRGSNRGDPSSPLTYLLLLPSNRIKVIIRKEIKVEQKELQCFSLTDDLTCFLHHKRSWAHSSLLHLHDMINAQDLNLSIQNRSLLV